MSNITGKGVAKVFLTNRISATVIIPIEIARRQGLSGSSHVLIEETNNGILIRRLDL